MNTIKKKVVIHKAHSEMNKNMLSKNQEKAVGKEGANQKFPQYTAPEWSTKGKWKSKHKYAFLV